MFVSSLSSHFVAAVCSRCLPAVPLLFRGVSGSPCGAVTCSGVSGFGVSFPFRTCEILYFFTETIMNARKYKRLHFRSVSGTPCPIAKRFVCPAESFLSLLTVIEPQSAESPNATCVRSNRFRLSRLLPYRLSETSVANIA